MRTQPGSIGPGRTFSISHAVPPSLAPGLSSAPLHVPLLLPIFLPLFLCLRWERPASPWSGKFQDLGVAQGSRQSHLLQAGFGSRPCHPRAGWGEHSPRVVQLVSLEFCVRVWGQRLC